MQGKFSGVCETNRLYF